MGFNFFSIFSTCSHNTPPPPRFGATYTSLQPKITKTLLTAFLEPTKPLTTHFGAVVALSALGPSVRFFLLWQSHTKVACATVRALLIVLVELWGAFGLRLLRSLRQVTEALLVPNIAAYYRLLLPEMQSADESKRAEATRVYDALLVSTWLGITQSHIWQHAIS